MHLHNYYNAWILAIIKIETSISVLPFFYHILLFVMITKVVRFPYRHLCQKRYCYVPQEILTRIAESHWHSLKHSGGMSVCLYVSVLFDVIVTTRFSSFITSLFFYRICNGIRKPTDPYVFGSFRYLVLFSSHTIYIQM